MCCGEVNHHACVWFSAGASGVLGVHANSIIDNSIASCVIKLLDVPAHLCGAHQSFGDTSLIRHDEDRRPSKFPQARYHAR